MADGKMAVVDIVLDEPVGTILWTGSLDSGGWTFDAREGIDEVTTRRYEKAIPKLPESNKWLEKMGFRGPNGRQYQGWSGFTGVLGALEKTLPLMGLQIDRSACEWPPYIRTNLPQDIDTERMEEQKEAWEQYEAADSAAELDAFLKRNSGDGI